MHLIRVDGCCYPVMVWRKRCWRTDAPRLLIPSYLPNATAVDVLRACVEAIQRYTPEAHEVWVVDNHSPWRHARELLRWPGINVALSLRTPVPREHRETVRRTPRAQRGAAANQTQWGSYANAVALELAVRLVDRRTPCLMTMHMDTMPCRTGWLSFLRGKLNDRVKAAGVRMDRIRTPEGILHVIGYLVDFPTFQKLGLDFFPRLPQYDVGDYVTVALRAAGHEVFACHNTLHEPDLIASIPDASPLKRVYMDRSFDDEGNVIFLHMGRAIPKAIGTYSVNGQRVVTSDEYRAAGKTSAEEWLDLAKKLVGIEDVEAQKRIHH